MATEWQTAQGFLEHEQLREVFRFTAEYQDRQSDRGGNRRRAGPLFVIWWPYGWVALLRRHLLAHDTRVYGGPMTSVKQIQVTFDCAEPERVARFWCEVLGYVVPPPPEGFATWDDFSRALPPEDQGSFFACIDPSGVGPRLFFQRVPEGKVVKNRLHLDVRVGTGPVGGERLAVLETECARLVRSARHACDYCLLMTTTSHAS
jgi:hypothetical protein